MALWSQLRGKVRSASNRLRTTKRVMIENRRLSHAPLDPRVVRPNYMSMDEFIDVPWLQSLDGYVAERVAARLASGGGFKQFQTGPFKRGMLSKRLPGSQEIYLSSPKGESEGFEGYYRLDKAEFWEPGPQVEEFSELVAFIRTLPFESFGRMIILCSNNPRAVTPHRDHPRTDLAHNFIWFRTNPRKRLFMLDDRTGAKKYVEGHSAWFDTVNQYHGADAAEGLTFSMRVDGVFTPELKALMPDPGENLASAPSLWAALSN